MNELRLALRALRKRPLFTAIAVVTLALGIGATTTLFTIVNAVLLRPLPYPEAKRIVSISESEDGKDGQVVAAPDYFEWVRSAHSFEGLAAYGPTAAVLTGRGEPARLVICPHGAPPSLIRSSLCGTSDGELTGVRCSGEPQTERDRGAVWGGASPVKSRSFPQAARPMLGTS